MTAQPRSFQNWAANVQHLQPRMGRARAGAGAGVRLYAGPPAAEGEAAEGPHCVRWAGDHCSHHSGQLPALHWAQPSHSRKLNGRRSAAATTAVPPCRRDVRAEGGGRRQV